MKKLGILVLAMVFVFGISAVGMAADDDFAAQVTVLEDITVTQQQNLVFEDIAADYSGEVTQEQAAELTLDGQEDEAYSIDLEPVASFHLDDPDNALSVTDLTITDNATTDGIFDEAAHTIHIDGTLNADGNQEVGTHSENVTVTVTYDN